MVVNKAAFIMNIKGPRVFNYNSILTRLSATRTWIKYIIDFIIIHFTSLVVVMKNDTSTRMLISREIKRQLPTSSIKFQLNFYSNLANLGVVHETAVYRRGAGVSSLNPCIYSLICYALYKET